MPDYSSLTEFLPILAGALFLFLVMKFGIKKNKVPIYSETAPLIKESAVWINDSAPHKTVDEILGEALIINGNDPRRIPNHRDYCMNNYSMIAISDRPANGPPKTPKDRELTILSGDYSLFLDAMLISGHSSGLFLGYADSDRLKLQIL